jgi:hypothetical protein
MTRRRVRVVHAAALAATGSLVLAGGAQADDSPPGNLGNGLGRLVQPRPAKAGPLREDPSRLAVRDRAGRVLVDVYGRDGVPLALVRQNSQASGLHVVTQSADQKALEGYVAVSQVRALARAVGVASVLQSPRPATNVGAATSQGVRAQRVDRVRAGIDGRGVTVAALSDSFDTATETVGGDPLTIHAADDIRTNDLPRDGVTVLEDSPGGTDEGRAMLQIVHDIAPCARECFATANGGQLNFAANIRALADPGGPCAANVIVDDVIYFAEPMFIESVIGDAVDDVAAQGVHYFSSAGNGSSHQAYQAPLRIVAPDRPGDRSNIDLTGVDPALYAGGFQDFDPGPGVDIAQDGAVADGGLFDMQWDDPFDPNGTKLSEPVLEQTGEITPAQPVATIPFDGTAGETIRGVVDAIPSGTTDLILTLRDPDGNVLQEADRGISPEILFQKLARTGRYTFEVSGFQGDLGDFTFELRDVVSPSRTTTDLNLLLFTDTGQFTGLVANDVNQLSGNPIELLPVAGDGPFQIVIAKANTDHGAATQVRYAMTDGLQQTEYVNQLAPATWGHNVARGASSVAAYDPFRPLLPEDFTSVGGELPILFDSSGNRLPQPDVRRKPDLAATDGGNTTFFVADSILDGDDQPNFFGTSAAAPHAAGIAALALQAHGGPGSLSPTAMRSLLESSTFPHDLDGQHSEASGGGLTITADGAQGAERRTDPRFETTGSMTDPTFFLVEYSGPDSIVSLTFDGAGANPTGLGRRGLVFDPRAFLAIPALGGPPLTEQGFPFTVGAASEGIDPSAITAQFARPGVGQANNRQFQQMTVRFHAGALGGGRFISFGIDRDEAQTAAGDAEGGNSADALGAGVLFPEGVVVGDGLAYRAVTSTGQVLAGTLRNRIGAG